jgi:hypothetical protein
MIGVDGSLIHNPAMFHDYVFTIAAPTRTPTPAP